MTNAMDDMPMIERVARALVRHQYPSFSESDVDEMFDGFVGDARAAIEAMREATKEMIAAGDDKADDCLDHDWDSGGDGYGYNEYATLRSDAPLQIWQAMIVAAIKEQS